VLGIEHGIFYFLEARTRETQAARLSAQLAEARLGALRMQINPHFLFNSLNAITVLVRDQDTRVATRMLEELGEVLHRVLRTERRHEVPLSEEIDFLKRYLALEQMRFSDRLRPTVDVDPAVLGAAVPDLVLQPLVENALRHGVARRTESGLVSITAKREADDLVLTVADDGPGPEPYGEPGERRDGAQAAAVSWAGSGVGLANTRERLATLYGDRGRLELGKRPGGGAMVTIRIPYRQITHSDGTAAGG
jgi:sensor histidine kinase YesM